MGDPEVFRQHRGTGQHVQNAICSPQDVNTLRASSHFLCQARLLTTHWDNPEAGGGGREGGGERTEEAGRADQL